MRDTVVIRSPDGRSTATVCPDHGALVSSLVVPWNGAPRDLLFRRSWFWESIVDGGGIPFLFPVVGRHRRDEQFDRYTHDGHDYTMPLHGFSLRQRWKIEEQGAHHVILSLRDNDSTRSFFPFSFFVSLKYEIGNGTFTCHQKFTNEGDRPMPLAAGFHPYFSFSPGEIDACELHGSFARVGTYRSGFTEIDRWEATPNTVNAMDMASGSRVIRLGDTRDLLITMNGKPYLTCTLRDGEADKEFRYVQFYRSGKDGFLCIEPWMDLPNVLNRTADYHVMDNATASFAISVHAD